MTKADDYHRRHDDGLAVWGTDSDDVTDLHHPLAGWTLASSDRHMRWVLRLYLLVYGALVIGAVIALWRADVLGKLPGQWVIASVTAAIVLGVLLALFSRSPPRRRDSTPPDESR